MAVIVMDFLVYKDPHSMIENTSEDQVFAQIDAEKIKEEAVKAAKESLISTLQGNKPKYSWEEKGKAAPENYDELFQEVEKRVPKFDPDEIDRKVDEKLAAREEAERKRLEEDAKKTFETQEQRKKQFDAEWYDLVQKGKMPAVAPELQEKINKGEKLAKEEIMADEGLKARLELAQLAQNKSAKLAYYEDYSNREPAGASAPVLGGRPSTPQRQSQELTYEDIHENAKKEFPWLR